MSELWTGNGACTGSGREEAAQEVLPGDEDIVCGELRL